MADLPSEELLDSHDRHDCAAEAKAEEIVARNRIALLPRGADASMLRSGLKCIPVADVQPFETCLAVSGTSRCPTFTSRLSENRHRHAQGRLFELTFEGRRRTDQRHPVGSGTPLPLLGHQRCMCVGG